MHVARNVHVFRDIFMGSSMRRDTWQALSGMESFALGNYWRVILENKGFRVTPKKKGQNEEKGRAVVFANA